MSRKKALRGWLRDFKEEGVTVEKITHGKHFKVFCRKGDKTFIAVLTIAKDDKRVRRDVIRTLLA